MTREEALEKIKELEVYIKELDEKVGFEDDELFLLSVDDYNKYKNDIPYIHAEWWLRSKVSRFTAPCVCEDGKIREMIIRANIGVRPALRYNPLTTISKNNIINYKGGFPFKIIDDKKHIAIACVPIDFKPYASLVSHYETSDVRDFVLNWEGFQYYGKL